MGILMSQGPMITLILLAILANTDPRTTSIEHCEEDDIDCIWIETYGPGPHPAPMTSTWCEHCQRR